LSISATLKRKNVDTQKFLDDAITASNKGEPLPSAVYIGQTVDPKYEELAKEEIINIKSRIREEKIKKEKKAKRDQIFKS
jgi:hypothetical protein